MTLALWLGSNKQVQWVMVLTKYKFAAFPRSCKKKNSDAQTLGTKYLIWTKMPQRDYNQLGSSWRLLSWPVVALSTWNRRWRTKKIHLGHECTPQAMHEEQWNGSTTDPQASVGIPKMVSQRKWDISASARCGRLPFSSKPQSGS